MRLLFVVSLAAVLAAAVAAVPAGAVMRWGPTATVSDADGFNVRVGIDARGDALAVWEERSESGPTIGYSWRPPRGEWTPPRRVAGRTALIGGELAMTPDGTAVLGYTTADNRIAVASARPGRAFGEPEYLTPPGPQRIPPDVVVDDEGNVIAGWTQSRGQEGSDVVVASRRVGGSFGEPQTLARGTTGLPPDLAVNAAGAAVAGWSTSYGGQAHVSYRPPGGSFGPAERVPSLRSGSARPIIAINVLGEVVAGETSSTPVGDGSGGTRFAVRSALGEWGDEVTLDTGGFISSLLAEPSGAFGLVFQRTDETGGRSVYFSERRQDGTLVGPERLSSPNSYGPRVAMNLRGDMLGTWSPDFHGYGAGTRVAIADRPAGGRFGEETIVSTDPNSIGSDAGLNDAGQAVVAWTRHERTGEPFPARVQARVRDDLSLPPLPFPPDVALGPAPDVSLGDDGVLVVDPRCSENCIVKPYGLVVGGERIVAGSGDRVRLRARRGRRVRVRFGKRAARVAREAFAAGRRPWVSISVTARGRSPRPVTVSRRVRLRR